MTDNELIIIKKSLEELQNIILKDIKARQKIVAKQYSYTSLSDEKLLSKESPESYYHFKDLNVKIFITKIHNEKYTVRCDNWQPKAFIKKKNAVIYRGQMSIGLHNNLEDCIDLFYTIIQEYINQKQNKGLF